MAKHQAQVRFLTRFGRLVRDWEEAGERAARLVTDFRGYEEDMAEAVSMAGLLPSGHRAALGAKIEAKLVVARETLLELADDVKATAARARALVRDLEETGTKCAMR